MGIDRKIAGIKHLMEPLDRSECKKFVLNNVVTLHTAFIKKNTELKRAVAGCQILCKPLQQKVPYINGCTTCQNKKQLHEITSIGTNLRVQGNDYVVVGSTTELHVQTVNVRLWSRTRAIRSRVHVHAQATGKGDDTSPLQLITIPK